MHLMRIQQEPRLAAWTFRPLKTFPRHLDGTALRNINRIDNLPATNWCDFVWNTSIFMHQTLVNTEVSGAESYTYTFLWTSAQYWEKPLKSWNKLQGVIVTFHYTYSYLDFHSQIHPPQRKIRPSTKPKETTSFFECFVFFALHSNAVWAGNIWLKLLIELNWETSLASHQNDIPESLVKSRTLQGTWILKQFLCKMLRFFYRSQWHVFFLMFFFNALYCK